MIWMHIELVWAFYWEIPFFALRLPNIPTSHFATTIDASCPWWIFYPRVLSVSAPPVGSGEDVQPREPELSTCNLTRRRSSNSIGHFGKEGAFLSPREGWRGVRKGQQSRAQYRGGQNLIRETRLANEPDTHFTCTKPEEILFNNADCNLTAERKRSL